MSFPKSLKEAIQNLEKKSGEKASDMKQVCSSSDFIYSRKKMDPRFVKKRSSCQYFAIPNLSYS